MAILAIRAELSRYQITKVNMVSDVVQKFTINQFFHNLWTENNQCDKSL